MPLLSNLERFYLEKYLRLPHRYLFSFSSLFMIVGLVISVMVLSAGLNLFEGYQKTLHSVLLQSIPHIDITHASNEFVNNKETSRILSSLDKNPAIMSADPVINLNVMAHNDDHTRMCLLKAYRHDKPKGEVWYHKYLIDGEILPRDNGIIIGFYLAREMNVGLGDTLLISYPQLNRISAMGMYPGQRELIVTGIYQSGYYEFDRSLVITSTETAQGFLLSGHVYSGIEVRLKLHYVNKTDQLAREINPGPFYNVIPWTTYYSGLFRLIEVEKWLIFIVFSFLVLIAGINVISAAQTVMLDKRNEIAIMKTIGAASTSLKRLLFLRIGVSCALSVLIGQAMGVIASYLIVKQKLYHLKGDVYFIDHITMHVSLFNQVIIFLVALFIIMICIIIPLRKMEKVQILDVFRTV